MSNPRPQDFVALPLNEAPDSVKELSSQINDLNNFIKLVNSGQYLGANSDIVSKLRNFLFDIRYQIIKTYDSEQWVVDKKLELKE